MLESNRNNTDYTLRLLTARSMPFYFKPDENCWEERSGSSENGDESQAFF